MSRIRGIEARAQKEVLQTRAHESNIVTIKKKNEDQSSKSKDEVEKQQIRELLHKLPKLDKIFEVHRKIGEGTFSSVYLGSLRQHSALSAADKRWFAIKHLVPTAHPARIEHELRCLQDMGGQDNVIGVDLCLRNFDTIVFIMPYIPHRKFSEYVGEMDAAELRRYMRALMVALRRVHSFGVIHRDVKPSNFLYDRENQRYLLVDFGLAQRLVTIPPLAAPSAPAPAPAAPAAPADPAPAPAAPAPAPAAPAPPPAHCNGTRKRARTEEEAQTEAKRMALDLRVGARGPPLPAPAAASPSPSPTPSPAAPALPPIKKPAWCSCAGAGGVCARCTALVAARAPRAGTQGFRPPEVLLKCVHQTTAVDMWASGVVLASILTARYPFFRAGDDVAALAELADLLGTRALQRAAASLGRRLVMSSSRRGVCLRKLCARLRGAVPPAPPAPPPTAAPPAPPARCERCHQLTTLCLCRDDPDQPETEVPGRVTAGFPDSAFALAWRLLDPNPRTRISADDALQHPFLADT
ncbi:cell division cycle 7-related protein kinase-like [Plodia interpunctella]|uniref:cell division cycle 7-related protein kinase-like n=1 Tax=Plodia interpunctella TaxID=58824 RepID=UPI00236782C8|nr:cell division cycle 7-related protein kinase-like [Plodia interpunctella]